MVLVPAFLLFPASFGRYKVASQGIMLVLSYEGISYEENCQIVRTRLKQYKDFFRFIGFDAGSYSFI